MGYLNKRYLILSLFFAIRKICRQTECGKHADILRADLSDMYRTLKMFTVGIFLGGALYCGGPLKSYLVDGKFILIAPLEVLFINQNTPTGFAIANVVVSIIAGFGALGTILYGGLIIFGILMYSSQINLIGQDFKELDEMWAEDSSVSLAYKQSFLKNICIKRQDIQKYIFF